MQQTTTPQTEQKTTLKSRPHTPPSSGMDVRTLDEPYYVVITGSNIRSTLPGKDFTPKVYDTEEIAQASIVAEIAHRKRMGTRSLTPKSPISVAEYDWKYSAYVNTPKE